jgi:hypothetical protein
MVSKARSSPRRGFSLGHGRLFGKPSWLARADHSPCKRAEELRAPTERWSALSFCRMNNEICLLDLEISADPESGGGIYDRELEVKREGFPENGVVEIMGPEVFYRLGE